MSAQNTQIVVKDVTKYYGDLHALGPISLNITSGEFVCILGKSGCGKSTLWKIISALEKPSQGAIIINGRNLEKTDPTIGVVFQSHALLPWLTVRENVEMVYKLQGRKINTQRIDEVLRIVDMQNFEDSKPKELSGGMAQRVAIARSIVSNPKILLMDEPFGALDAFTRLNLQNKLISIWDSHVNDIVVFITHDIEEAVSLATRVIILSPRPGIVYKEFKVPLSYPRDRTSMEFIKLRGLIAQDLSTHLNN